MFLYVRSDPCVWSWAIGFQFENFRILALLTPKIYIFTSDVSKVLSVLLFSSGSNFKLVLG